MNVRQNKGVELYDKDWGRYKVEQNNARSHMPSWLIIKEREKGNGKRRDKIEIKDREKREK